MSASENNNRSKVKEHWDRLASDWQIESVAVTHRDVWQRWLEIELLKKAIKPNGRCIDIGCGTGYAARRLSPLVDEMVGLDYSVEMIGRACNPVDDIPNPDNLSFLTGDVLKLPSALKGSFDQAYSVRCLINILDRERQSLALEEIADLIKPGGQLILIEGNSRGRQALDEMRDALGLETMPAVWHNLDFDPDWLENSLRRQFDVVERRGFGAYDLISRVVHPLLVAPEQPQYGAKINEIAANVALYATDFETLSRVVYLVLHKRR
ncbi:putative Methyltransferase type 11 [Rhodospirillaceae bacterium LM-1]|nr:putative Methyltransferase type 11 [Rhodospirillaceae bacterium LM-1]